MTEKRSGESKVPKQPRRVKYALFTLEHGDRLGYIHKDTYRFTVIGCSKKSVERAYPGYWAQPLGGLTKKQKAWVNLEPRTESDSQET